MEAAQLGVVSLHGPHIDNSRAKYEKFKAEGVSYGISNAEEIAQCFSSLSAKELEAKAKKAKNISKVDMVAVEQSVKAIKKALRV